MANSRLEVSPYHGLVLFEVLFSIVVHNLWMSLSIGKARRKYKVSYPTMYAPPGHKDGEKFNCFQRGHQNCLENWPSHVVLTLLASIKFPLLGFVSGIVYNVGRIVYFRGYCTGVPKARLRGSFFYLANLAQVVAISVTAVQCLWGKF